nr:urate hydroxylase PuuD [uncultured Rhodopila sp.]
MTDTLLDWVSLLVRWTHVMAGIAWIGSSFYFIALDAGLRPNPRLDPRVKGEAWQVHGGGFYNIQKFSVAPEFMPEHLTWFKWEAYSTWIFGFILLVLVYYLNPSIYLIDPAVLAMDPLNAVLFAAGSLAAGWVIYDLLCRSRIGRSTARLAAAGFVLFVAATFAYTHLFSGRGAFIQAGALVGTIMAANVLFIIIPNQRKTVAALLKNQPPDPAWGAQAKQRSVHNNYLTLPVLFTMISNHYAFTYASHWSWLILACIFVASFLVRHWFNTMHTGAIPDWRLWPAAVVPVLAAVALSIIGQSSAPAGSADAAAVTFAEVKPIVDQRCQVCHSARPQFPGFSEAPKGVMFDTASQIRLQAPQIMAQAVKTHTMPLGNVTQITDAERATLGAWIQAGSRLE